MTRPDWKCPKCGAPANDHGKGGADECHDPSRSTGCMGLICECDGDVNDDHGSYEKPCPEARCYHCRWAGQLPSAKDIAKHKRESKLDPKTLTGWQREAWDAGWRPTK